MKGSNYDYVAKLLAALFCITEDALAKSIFSNIVIRNEVAWNHLRWATFLRRLVACGIDQEANYLITVRSEGFCQFNKLESHKLQCVPNQESCQSQSFVKKGPIMLLTGSLSL